MSQLAMKALSPFAHLVVERTADRYKSGATKDELITEIDSQLQNDKDEELAADVRHAMDMLKDKKTLSTVVRPLLTLGLTLGYLGITAFLLLNTDNPNEVLTAFLGIYGPIIGFWFGERSAKGQSDVAKGG